MSTPLSTALRERTAAAHEEAETASFMTELLSGRACPAAFTALAVQQLVIYRALEETVSAHYADHPLVRPLDDRVLHRVAAIEADLEVLIGPDAPVRLANGQAAITPSTAAYATALRDRHSPEMVVANHYVRYLGDLSGGQIIAAMMRRHYGLPDEALGFYRFPGIARLKPYKDDYRRRLDALPTTPAQREAILDHAVQSFRMNQAVFADLHTARAPEHAAAGVEA